MLMPPLLSLAVEEALECHGLEALGQAAAELSTAYRSGPGGGRSPVSTEVHRLAYLATRLPATYAAVHAVLSEVSSRLPQAEITSLLDLGAGPGTAAWAATAVLPRLERVTLVERDEAWIQTGRSLARSGGSPLLVAAEWICADLRSEPSLDPHDLVVASYALGELESQQLDQVLGAAWAAASTALVVVEPGTTAGFGVVRRVRSRLVEIGGHLVAPCPHERDCPLPAGDWCHFAQRVERSSVHRRLKAAALGHEDEKHTYVAASRAPAATCAARVLRHPLRRSGHTRLELCAQDGLRTLTVARSDGVRWQQARRTAWGDEWPD